MCNSHLFVINSSILKQQRPLQEKELRILDQRLTQLNKNFKRQTRFLFVWILVALIVGTFAFFRIDKTNDTVVLFIIAIVVIYIGIGVWVISREYFKQTREQKSIVYLKEKNLVTSVEIISNTFYELREQEDEGVHYLFQLDHNKVFSFGGQEFYPTKRFPSNKFEVVEGRGLNNEILFVKTFIYGSKIKPARIITGQEKWDLLRKSSYPDPSKLTLVEGRIEDYV